MRRLREILWDFEELFPEPWYQNIRRIFRALRFLCLLLLLALLTAAVGFSMPGRKAPEGAESVPEALLSLDGVDTAIALPNKLKALSPRTPVSLRFTVQARRGDMLYFRSVYAPMRVYIDDVLLYEYGTEGSYPSFFLDPPAMAESIGLPDSDAPQEVRFDYLSPAARDNLVLYAPLVGTDTAIFQSLFDSRGASLLLSAFFILLGASLVFASLFFLSYMKKGLNLRLPGYFSLAVGIWGCSENTLAVFLLRKPALLYLASFISLFSLSIPLLEFTVLLLDLRKNPLLIALRALTRLSVLAALFLQLTGILQFSQSMYYFHVLVPVSIVLDFACTLYSWLVQKKPMARLLSFAFLTLALAALLEVLNYYMNISWQFSFIFQLGVVAFIIHCLALVSLSTRQLFTLSLRAVEMQSELRFIEKSIDIQKERNHLLLSHAEEVRRQRHDLRHQLAVIRSYLDSGQTEALKTYLNACMHAIPSEQNMVYCENLVVNAIIAHYVSIAEAHGIDIAVHTVVPDQNPHISDNALCVVLGNLLENAIEACDRMQDRNRFLHLSTAVQGELLFISMDNSYQGKCRVENGHFYSSKRRAQIGVGLESIRSTAERHEGTADFTPGRGVFRSEVYLRL